MLYKIGCKRLVSFEKKNAATCFTHSVFIGPLHMFEHHKMYNDIAVVWYFGKVDLYV
jgi:hypothetical protein